MKHSARHPQRSWTNCFRRTASCATAALLMLCLTSATPASAASCGSLAQITSDIWTEHRAVISTVGCLNPAACTAVQIANYLDQMISFWNLLAGSSWAGIGPQRIDFDDTRSGTIWGTTGRVLVSLPSFADQVTVEIQETGGKDKTSAVICKTDGNGNTTKVEEKWFNNTGDRKDKSDERRTVEISGAYLQMISVHFDGKAFDPLRKFSYEVTATQDFPVVVTQPDLAVKFGTRRYAPATDSLTFETVVENQGDDTAGQFEIGYYLSPDATVTIGDIFLGSQPAGPLQPGEETRQRSFTVDVCEPLASQGLADGEYYVGRVADFEHAVSESDESNNNQTAMQTITATCDPDLTFALANRNYAPLTDDLTLETVVENQGAGTAGPFKIGYYLSPDPTITIGTILPGSPGSPGSVTIVGDTFLGFHLVGSLQPGEQTSQRSLTVNVCDVLAANGLADGDYYVGRYVDFERTVNESDETNNVQGAASSITVSCPGG